MLVEVQERCVYCRGETLATDSGLLQDTSSPDSRENSQRVKRATFCASMTSHPASADSKPLSLALACKDSILCQEWAASDEQQRPLEAIDDSESYVKDSDPVVPEDQLFSGVLLSLKKPRMD